MSLTEERFRTGAGEKYCKNGKIRCQGTSMSQVRKWREEFNDDVTPIDELWPECQCPNAAVDGFFVCSFHGAKGARAQGQRPRDIMDLLPIDLSEKFQVLADNPNYLTRYEAIVLLNARVWELVEGLGEKIGGAEAWGSVSEALQCVKRDDTTSAIYYLEKALDDTRGIKDTWKEILEIESTLNRTVDTEVKTAKELRVMASMDQVMGMISGIQQAIMKASELYIEPGKKQDFIYYMADRIRKLTNSGAGTVINQLDAASADDNGNAF